MEKLVGRKKEWQELEWAMQSHRSELIILKGRRRIGKTFLVRSFFNDSYTFHFVGAHNKSKSAQLSNFREALIKHSGNIGLLPFNNWHDAFTALSQYLEKCAEDRKVIFFDEMPWADTHGSDFVEEMEYFWANWVQNRDDIVFIACGSATSWMKEKIEDNQGGLHNRITHRIYLRPFFLSECKEYLQNHGFEWDEYTIMQMYMIFGGVPYYLSLLRPYMSLPQNVDNLLFVTGGDLSDEFDELYSALFKNADRYTSIIENLYTKREGLTRQQIEDCTGFSGGGLTKMLNNLESCDFIVSYQQFGNKTKQTLYRLCDFFTLFYLKFMRNNSSKDEQFWQHHFMDRSVASWEGFSFEQLCLRHLPQIKQGLGISGIATESSAWRYINQQDSNGKGAQIDLVIKRVDKMVHLCEMKFSENPYTITKEYEEKLKARRLLFMDVTGETRGVVLTMITPYGLKTGLHSSLIHSEITVKELFYQ
ncbi:MAG: AAA family ATPase [Bacteroidaceae bacterium]|nr:AAA family ATPase [Bacteroidaceae bacterium]